MCTTALKKQKKHFVLSHLNINMSKLPGAEKKTGDMQHKLSEKKGTPATNLTPVTQSAFLQHAQNQTSNSWLGTWHNFSIKKIAESYRLRNKEKGIHSVWHHDRNILNADNNQGMCHKIWDVHFNR